MTMVMALSVADIINGEMPSAMTEPKIAKSGFIVRRERRMPDFFEVRNRRTHAALNAWERTVASAAPETNRVKADVDNRADEDRAHRCAGMSLAADKGIQSDSQFNKYRSDKINRNIRGSISNRVVTCAEEIQKRCLKDKEKCH